MFYIQKDNIPLRIQEQIIQIEKSEEWKSIKEDDLKGIRAGFDNLDKRKIREELVREQHGICAYCMRRIKDDQSTTIEHFKSIKNKNDVLNYKNMLGCCHGGRNSAVTNKILCCDAAKGDKDITNGPFDKEFVDSLRYSKDGYIYTYPQNEKADYEINSILQLNGKKDNKGNLKFDTATQLVAGRKSTYRNYSNLMKQIDKKCADNQTKKIMEIKKIINRIESKDEYIEFAGMLLYLLKRRLR